MALRSNAFVQIVFYFVIPHAVILCFHNSYSWVLGFIVGISFLFVLIIQIGSAVGGTTSAFYGFNHGIVFCLFLLNISIPYVYILYLLACYLGFSSLLDDFFFLVGNLI